METIINSAIISIKYKYDAPVNPANRTIGLDITPERIIPNIAIPNMTICFLIIVKQAQKKLYTETTPPLINKITNSFLRTLNETKSFVCCKAASQKLNL